MMARIYKPARTAMQSGAAKTKEWVLEYEPEQPRQIEPLMGWTSSGDMRQQVQLADGCKRKVGHKPERAGLPGRARSRGCHHEIGERDAQAAEGHLSDRERLGAEPGLACPQPYDQRCEHEDHERIEREEPG